MAKDRGAWARAHPELAVAAVNLRISGVSERTVFERFRATVKDAPSYRELRAAYAERQVLKRSDATERRRAHERFKADGSVRKGDSNYLVRQRAQYTPKAKERLAQNMVTGYLVQEVGDRADQELDDPELLDFIGSDYEVGSP